MIFQLPSAAETIDLPAGPGAVISLPPSPLGVITNLRETLYFVREDGDYLLNQNGDYLVGEIVTPVRADVVDLGV